ncbi:MAG: CDP-diacylglycerol--serine O-phosphatidyltransferase [Gammaproteobacteria bacterium]|nr:CDP-diacylglycerol--serine O-phosphatidyltransferase [Gammaproteobacteria bacterium]
MADDPKTLIVEKRGRGIYLLPNAFTTAALFAGFYGVVAALNSRFEVAAIAVLFAMVLDALDGRIARMTNTTSAFGAEYDSMADMVSFGIAPSLIVYEWSLSSMSRAGFGQLGWVAAFLYTACAALRLARFNVQVGIADKRFFQGLASPSAAALMILMVWVSADVGISGADMHLLAVFVTIASGLLMVSNFTYYSFKEFGSRKRVPFMAMLILVFIFVFTSLDPPKILLLGFSVYALSGPGYAIFRWFRKRSRKQVGTPEK